MYSYPVSFGPFFRSSWFPVADFSFKQCLDADLKKQMDVICKYSLPVPMYAHKQREFHGGTAEQQQREDTPRDK